MCLKILIWDLLKKMNDKNIQEFVQKFVMTFFNQVDSEIITTELIYKIKAPKNLFHIFGEKPFLITFVSDAVQDSDCEFVTPGSQILKKIINICKSKGPISKGIAENRLGNKTDPSLKNAVRFYFYIKFESMSNFSDVSHVDLDANTLSAIDIKSSIVLDSDTNIESFDSSSLSTLFSKSLEEIRKKYSMTEKTILEKSSSKKQTEVKKIKDNYAELIEDIENQIKKSESNLLEVNDKNKFFDSSVNEISKLRNIQNHLIKSIGEKYQSKILYEIIGITFFRY